MGKRRQEIPKRELEVLLAVVRPRATRRTAAAELGISEHTVNAHLRSLFLRLGVSSAAQAVNALDEDD